MKTHWTLAELHKRFPDAPHHVGAVLRCTKATSGQGRYVKETSDLRGFADVVVHATPASSFTVDCQHNWPVELKQRDAEQLDLALLEGVFEGVLRCDIPPLLSGIRTGPVLHVRGDTTSLAVNVAAAMAIKSLVEGPAWVVVGTPEPEPA